MSTLVERLNALSKKQLVALVCEYSKEDKVAAVPSNTEADKKSDSDIAIVGMSCRFPGSVNSCDDFWELISTKNVAVTDDPSQRWNTSDYLGEEDESDKAYTMSAGLVDGIDQFDASFFNLSPREAETMDPQQRLALEEIWRALESAGIPSADCQDKNYGVFLGVGANEYMNFCRDYARKEDAGYIASGNVLNMIPGRAAYLLGIHGPVMAIDTACSSSLSAVHSAVSSLRRGECSLAIAGGVNVLLDPENFVSLAQAKMLSPTGRCHTFDKQADGYVRSEGCGIVILKTLSQAVADNDNVLAVIRGSAMSHNGHSASITAPSKKAQEQVISAALKDAGLQAGDVDLIEAHGTGTALGDPIELHAIDAVYGSKRKNNPLHVSSIKANIGHAEAAAGIAGLIKMVLSLRHKTIPPQANFSELNPNIHLESDQINIAAEAKPWPVRDRARVGGVSSFGFSGINLHLLLEEFSNKQTKTSESPVSMPYILTLSAKSKASLVQMANNYLQLFEDDAHTAIDHLCYTESVRKDHHPLRLCALGYSRKEMQQSLQQSLDNIDQREIDKPSLHPSPIVLTGETLFSPKLLLSLIHSFDSFKAVMTTYEAMLLELGITDINQYLEGCEQNAGKLSLDTEKELVIAALMGTVFLKWLTVLLPNFRRLPLYADGLIQLSLLTLLYDLNPLALLNESKKEVHENKKHFNLPKNIFFTCTDNKQITFDTKLLDRIVNTESFSSINDIVNDNKNESTPVFINDIADLSSFSKQLTKLYEADYDIQWKYLYSDKQHLVQTPLYPYDRRQYWVEGGPVIQSQNNVSESVIENIRVKKVINNATETRYQFSISSTSPHLMDDHRLFNRIVVPGSFYLSCACRLFREQYPIGEFFLKDVQFQKALALNEDEQRLLTITLRKREGGKQFDWFVESQSGSQKELVQHCQGQLSLSKSTESDEVLLDIDRIKSNWRSAIESELFYKDFDEKGYTLGPFFRYVGDGWVNKNTILRKVGQPPNTVNQNDWELHPGVLDSLFQVVGGLEELNFDTDKIFIPYQIQNFHLYKSQHESPYFWCLAKIDESVKSMTGDSIRVNLSIYDHQLQLCLKVDGFELRAISRATVEKSIALPSWLYKETWLPVLAGSKSPSKGVENSLLLSTSRQASNLEGYFLPDWQYLIGKPSESHVAMKGVESIVTLIRDAISLNSKPLRFVWHVSLSMPSTHELDEGRVPEELFVLYELLKILAVESNKDRKIQLLLVIQRSEGLAAIHEKMLFTVLRCFRQEQEGITCKAVGFDEQSHFIRDIETHVDNILQHTESEFHYSDGQLLVRRLSSIVNADLLTKDTASRPMKQVLITGGSGGIGQQLALYLARNESLSTLVLLGSRQQDEIIDTLLKEISQYNVDVHYYAVDLADSQKILALTQWLSNKKISIDTVFHAAAILHDALVEDVDKEQIKASFGIKCAAITTLLQHLPDKHTLVNFSSMAASVGSPGQSVYAATNSYLDSLSHYYSDQAMRVLSVNWGPWKHVGMAARLSEQHQNILVSKGIRQFSAADVFPLLIKLLSTKEKSVTLADIDSDVLIKSLPSSDQYLFSDSTSNDSVESETDGLKEKLVELENKEAFTLLYAFICSTVGEITRSDINKIENTDVGFFSLGMDSLMVLEFRKIVERALSIKVESSVIFNYPNPKKLANYLLEKVKQGQSELQSSPVAETSDFLSAHRDVDSIAAELEKELEL